MDQMRKALRKAKGLAWNSESRNGMTTSSKVVH